MLVHRNTAIIGRSLYEFKYNLHSSAQYLLITTNQCYHRLLSGSVGVRHWSHKASKNFLNYKMSDHLTKQSFSTQQQDFSQKPALRFIQYTKKGNDRLRFGVVSSDGIYLTNLSAVPNFPTDMLSFLESGVTVEEVKEKIKSFPTECITDNITLLPPITNPEKIICIGLNYAGHCLEQNKEPPKEPMFFSKFASTLVGPTDNIVRPSITDQVDWEVELAVIIGKQAKHVSTMEAMEYVFGYSVAQDISARDWQKQKNGGQFLIGKSMDTFCPLGPSIVHKSLVPDPHDLEVRCTINDIEKQNGNTNELIFNIPEIISRLSQSITLKPGDVILTGTPAGVGMHRKPPEYLRHGDCVVSEIQHLGQLRNKVVDE